MADRLLLLLVEREDIHRDVNSTNDRDKKRTGYHLEELTSPFASIT